MRITIAQINVTVGDLFGNTDKIIGIINEQKGKSDLVVFPELIICGYPPLDLIERPGFCEDQLEQLDRIVKATVGIAAIVGYFRPNRRDGKPFYNSLAFISDGEIKYTYDKRLLPNYGVFDEWRYFEPGKNVGIYEFKGIKLGLLICEDIWATEKTSDNRMLYGIDPVAETVKAGAEILITINASPSHVGKPEYRLEKFVAIAKEHSTAIIYANMVSGNDDLIFDGTSFGVDENGTLAYVMPSFEEATKTFTFFNGDNEGPGHYLITDDDWEPTDYKPMDPSEYFFKAIVLGIRDYIRKCGFKKAVIASSGGVDSALVLALAVEALGSENVEAITMPSAISSTGSVGDSQILCDNLGIALYNCPIVNIFDASIYAFENKITFGKDIKSLTKENMQARIRGMLLMGFANQFGNLVLNTGNKSEISCGYFTNYGDGVGGIAVIGDLYKTEVWNLCKWMNQHYYGKEVIPNAIIDKEPSAELYPGQKDTNSLPPYEILDAILIQYLEQSEIDPKILMECNDILKNTSMDLIKKIHNLVDRAEFKRRQIPHVIRVHQKAFGFGRRLPIAQKYQSK